VSPTATGTGAPKRAHDAEPDPRIAERRRQVEGERRRRLRRRAVGVLVVASLLGAGWALVQSPLLDTEAVVPAGVTDPARAAAVLEASGVRVGDPLAFVDGGEVARRVSALPWVESASVSRSWAGGTVEVRVTAREPVAVISAPDGQWLLVDVTGQVIGTSPNAAGVPVIGGVAAVPPGEQLGPVDQSLVGVAAALTPGLASRVAEVRPGPGGAAELRLADGGVVVLGQPGDLVGDDLGVRLRTVRTVLATVDLGCVERIDVRVPDTAVLTRNPSCA